MNDPHSASTCWQTAHPPHPGHSSAALGNGNAGDRDPGATALKWRATGDYALSQQQPQLRPGIAPGAPAQQQQQNIPRPGSAPAMNPAAHAKPQAAEAAIALDEEIVELEADGTPAAPTPSKIKFGAEIHRHHDWKRPTVKGGMLGGACRVRTFHGKLSDQGLEYIDVAIKRPGRHRPCSRRARVGMFDGKLKTSRWSSMPVLATELAAEQCFSRGPASRDVLSGRTIQNVDPAPTSLFTLIVPPRGRSAEIASPGRATVVAGVRRIDLAEFFEDDPCLSGGMGPRSITETRTAPSRLGRQVDPLAGGRELDRVGKKVVEHLLKLGLIGVNDRDIGGDRRHDG
jgi:hypothetical protein